MSKKFSGERTISSRIVVKPWNLTFSSRPLFFLLYAVRSYFISVLVSQPEKCASRATHVISITLRVLTVAWVPDGPIQS